MEEWLARQHAMWFSLEKVTQWLLFIFTGNQKDIDFYLCSRTSQPGRKMDSSTATRSSHRESSGQAGAEAMLFIDWRGSNTLKLTIFQNVSYGFHNPSARASDHILNCLMVSFLCSPNVLLLWFACRTPVDLVTMHASSISPRRKILRFQ